MQSALTPSRRRTKPISEAHRWLRQQRLFGRKRNRVETWQLLVILSTVTWMEPERCIVIDTEQPGEDSPSANCVRFPDNSVVWWRDDEESFGVSDPDGVDANHRFIIE